MNKIVKTGLLRAALIPAALVTAVGVGTYVQKNKDAPKVVLVKPLKETEIQGLDRYDLDQDEKHSIPEAKQFILVKLGFESGRNIEQAQERVQAVRSKLYELNHPKSLGDTILGLISEDPINPKEAGYENLEITSQALDQAMRELVEESKKKEKL